MTDLRHALAQARLGHWTEAHQLVQRDDSVSAAWLHGILHLQEGDFENAEYWYGKANQNFRTRGTLAEELDRFEAELADQFRQASAPPTGES